MDIRNLEHLLDIAIARAGSQAALAAHLTEVEQRSAPLDPSLISQWKTGRRPIGACHCIPIERLTEGEVTRHQLRPDVFGTEPDRDVDSAA